MKPTHEQVEEAKKILKKAGYIENYWHRDDIIQQCKNNDVKPTKKFVDKVIATIERYFDANHGINWEIIDCYIYELKNE